MIVEAIAFSNDGKIVCRDEEQKVLFVSGLVPGETAELNENLEIVRIIKESPNRVTPPCELFGECGGCDYQHIKIEEQRKQKLALIKHTFTNYFKLTIPEIIDCSEGLPEYSYRNRIQLHRRDNVIGFYKPKSRELLEVKECKITNQKINNYLKKKNYYQDYESDVTDIQIDIVNNQIGERLINSEKRHLSKSIDFSQVNEAGNDILLKLVDELVTRKKVTELFAGSGNFTFPLADKGCEVTAVELSKLLVTEGRKNTGKYKINWYNGKVEQYLAGYDLTESVLLDPPREGAVYLYQAPSINKVKEIVYVSCNLSTLGRDLKNLTGIGFVIDKIYFVDMFSQTKHLELVVKLARK